jgi:hypothetical protein
MRTLLLLVVATTLTVSSLVAAQSPQAPTRFTGTGGLHAEVAPSTAGRFALDAQLRALPVREPASTKAPATPALPVDSPPVPRNGARRFALTGASLQASAGESPNAAICGVTDQFFQDGFE